MKWSFVPKDVFPKYIVVNHDEGEPGTFKDRELAEIDPHQLIEGIIIAAWAEPGQQGLHLLPRRVRSRARAGSIRRSPRLTSKGFLGKASSGPKFDLDIVLHRGAGAYICGEESALLDSLEGYRGQPRLRPPFPAVKGLYGQPTVINNTETLSTLPSIVANGADWFKQWGTEKSPGTKMLLGVRARRTSPATTRSRSGRRWPTSSNLPAGCSTASQSRRSSPAARARRLLTDTDIAMDFEALEGSRDDARLRRHRVHGRHTCMVRNALVTTEFFEHESCGKCTPCREGTWWAVKVLERIEHGEGRQEDMDLLLDICDGIDGRSFCPLGDAAVVGVALATSSCSARSSSSTSPRAAARFEDEHRCWSARTRGRAGDAGVMPQPGSGVASDDEGRA